MSLKSVDPSIMCACRKQIHIHVQQQKMPSESKHEDK